MSKLAKAPGTTSRRISSMAFLCALLVVAIHVSWPHDVICGTWFVHYFIVKGLARIVAQFFFVEQTMAALVIGIG